MGSADHDRLVGDAADAVAWHEDVHWDRRARLATPAGRRMLDNLRALAPMFAASRVRARGATTAGTAEPQPEMVVQRQLLAAAADALAHAGSLKAMRRTVARAAQRGCGSTATLLAATDAGTRAPGSRSASLPRDSAIAQLLETTGGSVRVHPDDERSVFALLPHEEASWVVETAADAMVATRGSWPTF